MGDYDSSIFYLRRSCDAGTNKKKTEGDATPDGERMLALGADEVVATRGRSNSMSLPRYGEYGNNDGDAMVICSEVCER